MCSFIHVHVLIAAIATMCSFIHVHVLIAAIATKKENLFFKARGISTLLNV
jgi:hypothetical protein